MFVLWLWLTGCGLVPVPAPACDDPKVLQDLSLMVTGTRLMEQVRVARAAGDTDDLDTDGLPDPFHAITATDLVDHGLVRGVLGTERMCSGKVAGPDDPPRVMVWSAGVHHDPQQTWYARGDATPMVWLWCDARLKPDAPGCQRLLLSDEVWRAAWPDLPRPAPKAVAP